MFLLTKATGVGSLKRFDSKIKIESVPRFNSETFSKKNSQTEIKRYFHNFKIKRNFPLIIRTYIEYSVTLFVFEF